MGGRQFTKMKRLFYMYTDVHLFHFHDKPKAKFVCHILILQGSKMTLVIEVDENWL
jgi:hypothetical protein